jgi:hypothetical protein
MTKDLARRLAVIIALVESSPNKTLGRTAVMKLLYFLTAVRGVRLDYDFTLYSYGPFDSAVLQDLSYATNLDALKSQVVGYPTGYGYEIQPGPSANEAKEFAKEFIATHNKDIGWVISNFGSRSAADLELASTIVYVRKQGAALEADDLAKRVHEVKPRFSIEKIKEQIQELEALEILN